MRADIDEKFRVSFISGEKRRLCLPKLYVAAVAAEMDARVFEALGLLADLQGQARGTC